MSRAGLAALALLLTACTSEGGDASTPTATPEATASVTLTPRAPLTHKNITPEVILESLYDPRPYDASRPGHMTRIPPPSLELAAVEGPLYLEGVAYQGGEPASFERVRGSVEPACVETGPTARVRSSDWVLDLAGWSEPEPYVELFPRHGDRRGRDPLLLRATRLNGELATHVHELDGSPEPNAEGGLSYRPRFVLPAEGRWVVVVTAGPQWGCFVVDVGEESIREIPARWQRIEEAGAEHPSAPPPGSLSPSFAAERGPGVMESGYLIGGTSDRVCFPVGVTHDARSGDWVMRPASSYDVDFSRWEASYAVKLVPLHQPQGDESPDERTPDAERLLLTATLVDGPGLHTYVYEQPYFNALTLDRETDEANEFFHMAYFVLPRAGLWAVVLTSGPDWGCFVLGVS